MRKMQERYLRNRVKLDKILGPLRYMWFSFLPLLPLKVTGAGGGLGGQQRKKAALWIQSQPRRLPASHRALISL